jgi:hypothetical protein
MIHIETGKLKEKFKVIERINKTSNQSYQTQKFVLEIINTNKIENALFELIGKLAGEIDKYEQGDSLEVEFILKSSVKMHEGDNRYYPLIRAVSIKKCE